MLDASIEAGCRFELRKARRKTKDNRKGHFSHNAVILTGCYTGLSTKLREKFVNLFTETGNVHPCNTY